LDTKDDGACYVRLVARNLSIGSDGSFDGSRSKPLGICRQR
jgi:hypothetical protein